MEISSSSETSEIQAEPTAQHGLGRALSDAQVIASLGDVSITDQTTVLGDLVHFGNAVSFPVHRWYLQGRVLAGASPPRAGPVWKDQRQSRAGRVCRGRDNVLSLRDLDTVDSVVGVEYSPFAHFVTKTAVESLRLDPATLMLLVDDMLYEDLPETSRCRRWRRLQTRRSSTDQSSIGWLRCATRSRPIRRARRDFLLLGLAAIVEPLSNARKRWPSVADSPGG